MSDLLQQAMIDAAALREAAIKNAENTLIEKYSQEFNQTVQRLLEQETTSAPAADTAAPPVPITTDAAETSTANTTAPASTPDLSPAAIDPIAGDMEIAGDTGKKDAFSKVPGSFSDEDEEMITINFDQIRATLNEMLGEKYSTASSEYMTGDALDKGGNPIMKVKVKGSKNSVTEKWAEDELEEMTDSDNQNAAEGGELEEVELVNERPALQAQPASPPAPSAGQVKKLTPEEELTKLEPGIMNTDHGKRIIAIYKSLVAKNPEVTMQLVVDMFDAGIVKEEELEEQSAGASAKVRGQELKAQGEKEIARGTAMDAAEEKQSAGTSTMTPKPMEEEIELTEEELQELAEELHVDLKTGNLSDGYMGSTETQKREQRTVELAAARDSKATEEREAELEKMKDLMQENNKFKALSNDLLKTSTALKEQLEKVNLSNAKLLYTNKALGNISLNERQKNAIVESISKAGSVLEAKTIYETLQNAVENSEAKKEAPQSLREALNKAPSPFAVKKTSANSINDLMADRMKALAGIKKQ